MLGLHVPKQEKRDVVPANVVSGPIGLTQHIGKGVLGDPKAGGWRKTGFGLCMRQRQTKIEVLTVFSTQTRWESLSSFVSGDKSRIYLFRLIALVHFE